jgi:hypothetical protein
MRMSIEMMMNIHAWMLELEISLEIGKYNTSLINSSIRCCLLIVRFGKSCIFFVFEAGLRSR